MSKPGNNFAKRVLEAQKAERERKTQTGSSRSSPRRLARQILDRLNQVVNTVGGIRQAAEVSGIPLSTLSDALAGRSDLRSSAMAALAEATDTSLDWIMFGDSERQDRFRTPAPTASGGQLPSFISIPRFKLLSPGKPSRRQLDTNSQDSSIMFREDWMRRVGLDPKLAEALVAADDSMEPTIREGDLVVVDRSARQISDNGIYVLAVAGMAFIKRVQIQRDGSLVMKCDNSHYSDELVGADEAQDLQVEGRVRWVGHAL